MAIIAGQVTIIATGVAVQIPNHSGYAGVVLRAKASNNNSGIFVGNPDVTVTDTGNGNGYKLLPGEAISYACTNSDELWVNGTAGDVIYFTGN